jgi:hypothetical protein
MSHPGSGQVAFIYPLNPIFDWQGTTTPAAFYLNCSNLSNQGKRRSDPVSASCPSAPPLSSPPPTHNYHLIQLDSLVGCDQK